jgi:hypothetical protein
MDQSQPASDRQFLDLDLVLAAEDAINSGILPRIDVHALVGQDGSTRSLGRMADIELLKVVETAIRSGVFPEVNWKLDSTRRLGQLGFSEILLTVENAVNVGILPGVDGCVKARGQADVTPSAEQQSTQSRRDFDDANAEIENSEGSTGDRVGTLPAHVNKDDLIPFLKHNLSFWKARYEAMRKRYDELEEKHFILLSTVEFRRSKVYELERDVEEAHEREMKLLTDLSEMRRQFEDMEKQRDAAIAESRRLRRALETRTPSRDSVEPSLPSRLAWEMAADQRGIYSLPEAAASQDRLDQWSLSQPTAHPTLATNYLQHQDSVLTISSNRKVEMEPRSSLENLGRPRPVPRKPSWPQPDPNAP